MAISSALGAAGVFNPPTPVTPDYNNMIGQGLNAAAQTQQFNTAWTPAVIGTGQEGLQQELFGTPASTVTQSGKTYSFGAQPGTIGLMQAAAAPMAGIGGSTASALRKSAIGDVSNLGPQLLTAEEGVNPAATGLLNTLTSQAQNQLATNGGLTQEQLRQLQQNIRGAQGARGLGMGAGDAAQEGYYLQNNQLQRQQQNQAFAGSVLGANTAYYGGPTAVLGLPTPSVPGLNFSAPSVGLAQNPQSEIDQLFGTNYNANLSQQAGAWQTQTGAEQRLASFGEGSPNTSSNPYGTNQGGLVSGLTSSGSGGSGGGSMLGGIVGMFM